jgi:hypothetical protein
VSTPKPKPAPPRVPRRPPSVPQRRPPRPQRAFTGLAGSPLAEVVPFPVAAVATPPPQPKPSTRGLVLLHFCFDQQAGETKREHCPCEEHAERVTREVAEGYVQHGCADWLIVKNGKARTGTSLFRRAIVIRSVVIDGHKLFKVPSAWTPMDWDDRRSAKHESIKVNIRSKARQILSKLFAKGVILQEVFNTTKTDSDLDLLFEDAKKSETFLHLLSDHGQRALREKFFKVIESWWNNVLGFYRLSAAGSWFMPGAERGKGLLLMKGSFVQIDLIDGQHETDTRRVRGANHRASFWNGAWDYSEGTDPFTGFDDNNEGGGNDVKNFADSIVDGISDSKGVSHGRRAVLWGGGYFPLAVLPLRNKQNQKSSCRPSCYHRCYRPLRRSVIMQSTATVRQLAFLVRIGADRYLIDFDGRQAEVTDVLSAARHCDYATADAAAQRLRKRGFPMSLVTDHMGQPVTAEMIRAALEVERAEADLPKNQKDLDKLPMAEIRRRMKNEPAFRARVEQIEQQGGRR